MSGDPPDLSNPGAPTKATRPVQLTEAELRAVAGGLNPQPLPPGRWRDNPVPVPW